MRRKPDNKRSRKMGLLRAVSCDFGDRAFSIQLEEMGALIETEPLLPYCSYRLRVRALKKVIPAANRHATPPVTTESGAPIKAATAPASTSPNSGPPVKKITLIEVIRPRQLFGVASCRMVSRRIVVMVSAAPVTASIRSENQKNRDSPNA